jgi:hypothetical protein
MVWDKQDISPELETLLRAWSHMISAEIVSSSAGKNITEWCKKEACWKVIRDISELVLPDQLPPELQNRTVKVSGWGTKPDDRQVAVSPSELEAIARCKRVNAETWIRIVEWGRTSSSLDQKQLKMSTTLGNHAANGWSKEPGTSLAMDACVILNLATDRGIISGV